MIGIGDQAPEFELSDTDGVPGERVRTVVAGEDDDRWRLPRLHLAVGVLELELGCLVADPDHAALLTASRTSSGSGTGEIRPSLLR